MAPRPFVFSNTAISVDGKISTAARDRLSFGSAEDKRRMSALRARADAVLVGGNTMRTWGLPLVEDHARLDAPPARTRPLINAVLTRKGLGAMSARRFPDPRVELLVLSGEDIDRRAHAERLGATVLTTATPSVGWAIDALAARGCRSVLVEGGGDLLAQLLAADLLDELHVTLCPLVVGGRGAPTAVDGAGFPAEALPRLRLRSCEPVGDELYLRYALSRGGPDGASG